MEGSTLNDPGIRLTLYSSASRTSRISTPLEADIKSDNC